jgi:hypothetical protein
MRASWLETVFPNLSKNGYAIESPSTEDYNGIAWAAGDTERWWWPLEPDYWPPGVPRSATINSFVDAYATLGYVQCDTADPEPGFEKIAIYARPDGSPTHAARQLPTGAWTSKLGRSEDIVHTALAGLEGGQYGAVVRVMRRPRA